MSSKRILESRPGPDIPELGYNRYLLLTSRNMRSDRSCRCCVLFGSSMIGKDSESHSISSLRTTFMLCRGCRFDSGPFSSGWLDLVDIAFGLSPSMNESNLFMQIIVPIKFAAVRVPWTLAGSPHLQSQDGRFNETSRQMRGQRLQFMQHLFAKNWL